MAESYSELYVHYVWTTLNRESVLVDEVRGCVYAAIQAKCIDMGAEVIALYGIADHVHLLVRMSSSVSVGDFAQGIKGRSSYTARQVHAQQHFKWQEGYAAFSVSRWDVPKLQKYIQNQEEHHRLGTTKKQLEPKPQIRS